MIRKPELVRGTSLQGSELSRLGRTVETQDRLQTAFALASRNAAGPRIYFPPGGSFWGRVERGNGPYVLSKMYTAGGEMLLDEAVGELTDIDAYHVNRYPVNSGTIVRAWLSESRDHYLFSRPGCCYDGGTVTSPIYTDRFGCCSETPPLPATLVYTEDNGSSLDLTYAGFVEFPTALYVTNDQGLIGFGGGCPVNYSSRRIGGYFWMSSGQAADWSGGVPAHWATFLTPPGTVRVVFGYLCYDCVLGGGTGCDAFFNPLPDYQPCSVPTGGAGCTFFYWIPPGYYGLPSRFLGGDPAVIHVDSCDPYSGHGDAYVRNCASLDAEWTVTE